MAERPGQRRERRPAPEAAWVTLIAVLAWMVLTALALGGPQLPSSSGSPGGAWIHWIFPAALVFEVIFAVALAVLIIRGRRDTAEQRSGASRPDRAALVARWLRAVLRQVLIAALVVIPGLLLLNQLNIRPSRSRPRKLPSVAPAPFRTAATHSAGQPRTMHVNEQVLQDLLIALMLLAVLVTAAILVMRRQADTGPPPEEPVLPPEDDEENLREAVTAGRTALANLDDARAAVIACYLAMEASLAEAGAAREAADTPAELLHRAAQAGLVRTGAASRLTTLFYEARFSTHLFGSAQREAAEQALTQIHADLTAGAPA